ncbi:transcription factor IIH subunit 3 [Seminavis robusta]|uniref:Transcription factor IIH subunit 3 n=1 Tax=Seminavis robusta TaxID=568900 RepID=A0A9N8EWQ4_9STRA|nr:transcription factor IIH subunit 3 [Seminavis robusta]|eukprot:Sro2061_g313010.1 transcription factor IIH subunit 3 (461) ;mRNA; f:15454-16910
MHSSIFQDLQTTMSKQPSTTLCQHPKALWFFVVALGLGQTPEQRVRATAALRKRSNHHAQRNTPNLDAPIAPDQRLILMSANNNKRGDSRSLLTIVVDVSPIAWGERDLRRSASDRQRLAQGKRSVGPATLEEVLRAVQAFATAFASLERTSGLLIVAVAHNETAVVFPRKDHLARYFSSPETNACYDLRTIHVDLLEGVSQLVAMATSKVNAAVARTKMAQKGGEASSPPRPTSEAAMAAAFSTALCCINRFLVATKTGQGVSAVRSEHMMAQGNDGGVLAMIGGGVGSGGDKKKNKKANDWSPRILLIQATDDRSRDYNAFMNCAFAAVKHNVMVDGCFIPCGSKGSSTSSAFLEQASDLTGGVFLAPSGAAQVGGALTEVLMSVFLAPRSCRSALNLPALNKVDFRARCFETGDIVDMAFVCSQCLSIFKKKPKEICPTCQANIKVSKKQATGNKGL